MSSSNQFYPTRLNISWPNRTQNPVSTAVLKYHDSLSPTKKSKADQILRRFIFKSRVRIYFRAKSNQTLGQVNRVVVRSSELCFTLFRVQTNSARAFLFRKIFSVARFRVLGQAQPSPFGPLRNPNPRASSIYRVLTWQIFTPTPAFFLAATSFFLVSSSPRQLHAPCPWRPPLLSHGCSWELSSSPRPPWRSTPLPFRHGSGFFSSPLFSWACAVAPWLPSSYPWRGSPVPLRLLWPRASPWSPYLQRFPCRRAATSASRGQRLPSPSSASPSRREWLAPRKSTQPAPFLPAPSSPFYCAASPSHKPLRVHSSGSPAPSPAPPLFPTKPRQLAPPPLAAQPLGETPLFLQPRHLPWLPRC
jgi:hypothetical protein